MSELHLDLDELSDADLESLRLSAQVMGHKAVVEGRPLAEEFFGSLEQALRERIAARLADQPAVDLGRPTLTPPVEDDDRRLVTEYLGLLAANDRLSPAVRGAARQLQSAVNR